MVAEIDERVLGVEPSEGLDVDALNLMLQQMGLSEVDRLSISMKIEDEIIPNMEDFFQIDMDNDPRKDDMFTIVIEGDNFTVYQPQGGNVRIKVHPQ